MRINSRYLIYLALILLIASSFYNFGFQNQLQVIQQQHNPVTQYLQKEYGVSSIDELINQYKTRALQEIKSQIQNLPLSIQNQYLSKLEETFNTSELTPEKQILTSSYNLIATFPILLVTFLALLYSILHDKLQGKKREIIFVLILLLITALASYQIGRAIAQTQTIKISSGSFTSEASYIIFGDDTNGDGVYDVIYARNGRTGQIEYQDTDASKVIQWAIDQLTNGGKIYIKRGTYKVTETIIVKPNIVIEGERYGHYEYGTVIEGINISDVFATKPDIENYGIVIKDLMIKGSITNGIHFIDAVGCVLSGLRLITGGILLEKSSIFGSFNIVKKCDIDSPNGDGIKISGSDENIIIFNNIYSPSSNGIYTTAGNNIILGNVIVRAKSAGIRCESEGDLILSNIIDNTEGDGIVPSDKSLVMGNHVSAYTTNVGGNGILLYGLTNVRVIGNKISGSTFAHGIKIAGTGADNNIIVNNILLDGLDIQILVGTHIIKNNIGYVTESSGVASVTGDGTTTTFTVDVSHGLVSDKVAVKVALDRDGSIDKIYLVDTDGDGFKETIRIQVTYATAPASGESVPIYWSAEVVG